MTIDRPLGEPLPDWTPRPTAVAVRIEGRAVNVEPLDVVRHAADLFEAAQGEGSDPWLYTYLGSGPFETFDGFRGWLEGFAADPGLGVFVVIDRASGRAIGCASMMRMDPANGVVEIGNIFYGGGLQRTTGSTEAFFLIADYVFRTLGYRRFEWKCNALHERSRRAALRFGFTFEGIFRQHLIVKGRNRDTAWFAMLDHEWVSTIRPALVAWLDPSNFDADGNQLQRLETIRGNLS
ncbi:MAG: GNAT family N-acetyltransferase [Thermomicrobiales bacterium]|nr:GNAT family N-acetyltransferase [Thermomicrobiales bacterium]